MLCHLVCVADLRTFGGIVSFSRSSCWLALGCRVGGVLPHLASAAGCLLWSLGVCLCFFFQFFSLFLGFYDLVLINLCLAVSEIVYKLLSS